MGNMGQEDGGNGDANERGGGKPGGEGSPLGDVSLSMDAVLSLLSDRQRRDLLHYLANEPSQTASLDDCVAHLRKREGERTGEFPSCDQVEMALHHIHIPQLADAGIIDYDARSQQLRYWGHEELEAWLDRIRTEELKSD